MNINTTYTKIITDEDLMETVQHGSNLYPFQFYYEDLSVFDFNCVEWHWHTELEFIYIESGTVTLWIGEDQFNLTEGNGIFINTKVIHRLYSPSKALIPNFVFMPSFIAPCDSLIYQKYILPIISYPLPFLIFHKEVCWQAKVLSIMRQIISAQDSVSSKELLTSSLLQNLWLEIFENTDISYQEEHKEHSTASQARLQLMMQFIHLNYSQSISLDDIAELSKLCIKLIQTDYFFKTCSCFIFFVFDILKRCLYPPIRGNYPICRNISSAYSLSYQLKIILCYFSPNYHSFLSAFKIYLI